MKIVVRADVSLNKGTGHVMRCLTLGNVLKTTRFECHFVYCEHPGYLQPYYSERYGCEVGDYPCAEGYHRRSLTLSLFPAMSDDDERYVIESVLASEV